LHETTRNCQVFKSITSEGAIIKNEKAFSPIMSISDYITIDEPLLPLSDLLQDNESSDALLLGKVPKSQIRWTYNNFHTKIPNHKDKRTLAFLLYERNFLDPNQIEMPFYLEVSPYHAEGTYLYNTTIQLHEKQKIYGTMKYEDTTFESIKGKDFLLPLKTSSIKTKSVNSEALKEYFTAINKSVSNQEIHEYESRALYQYMKNRFSKEISALEPIRKKDVHKPHANLPIFSFLTAKHHHLMRTNPGYIHQHNSHELMKKQATMWGTVLGGWGVSEITGYSEISTLTIAGLTLGASCWTMYKLYEMFNPIRK
jgi:hypothetical protein